MLNNQISKANEYMLKERFCERTEIFQLNYLDEYLKNYDNILLLY